MSKDKGEKKPNEKAKGDISPEEEAARSKKKKLMIFLIGGIGLLLGIGAGIFFFLSGNSNKKDSHQPPPGEGAHEQQDHPVDSTHSSAHQEAPDSTHGSAKSDQKNKVDHDKKQGSKDDKKEDQKGHGKDEAHDKSDHAEQNGKKDDPKKGHGGGEKSADGAHGDSGAKKNDKKISESKLEGVDFGCTLPLTPFHLNLGNPLENRYIRLEIAVEYGCAEEQKAEIEKRLPQLRDAVISVTSRKTREFLLGTDGKEQLRKEIFNRINHYMTKKIDDVYITDILIE